LTPGYAIVDPHALYMAFYSPTTFFYFLAF